MVHGRFITKCKPHIPNRFKIKSHCSILQLRWNHDRNPSYEQHHTFRFINNLFTTLLLSTIFIFLSMFIAKISLKKERLTITFIWPVSFLTDVSSLAFNRLISAISASNFCCQARNVSMVTRVPSNFFYKQHTIEEKVYIWYKLHILLMTNISV